VAWTYKGDYYFGNECDSGIGAGKPNQVFNRLENEPERAYSEGYKTLQR